jgi:hypothetical protein
MPSAYLLCYLPLLSLTGAWPSCDSGSVRTPQSPAVFMILWFCDPVILWSCDPVILGVLQLLWVKLPLGSWNLGVTRLLRYCCQSYLESCFLWVLQGWVGSQSPEFALGTWENWKEPMPLAGLRFVFPWFLWGQSYRWVLEKMLWPQLWSWVWQSSGAPGCVQSPGSRASSVILWS